MRFPCNFFVLYLALVILTRDRTYGFPFFTQGRDMSLHECFHVPCRLTPQAHVPFLGRSTYHGPRSDPPRTKVVQVQCNSSYSNTNLRIELRIFLFLFGLGGWEKIKVLIYSVRWWSAAISSHARNAAKRDADPLTKKERPDSWIEKKRPSGSWGYMNPAVAGFRNRSTTCLAWFWPVTSL